MANTLTGRTLAHFRVGAPIGAGGMGQVYRAADTKLGRDVALKVLPEEMASSAEMLERFQREARAVAALNHPNIVTIYSVEASDGIHFLTMELVEGQSLDRLIPSGGLAVDRIMGIAAWRWRHARSNSIPTIPAGTGTPTTTTPTVEVTTGPRSTSCSK